MRMRSFLICLGELSLGGALFFGIYLLLVKLTGKRLTNRCRYFLCLLVLVRLMVPWGVDLSKLAEVLPNVWNQEEPMAGEVPNWQVPDQPVLSDEKGKDITPAFTADRTDSSNAAVPADRDTFREGEAGIPGAGTRIPWEWGLFSLWMAGFFVRGGKTVVSYRRLTKALAPTSRKAEPEDEAFFRSLYPKTRVTLWQSPHIHTPFLYGVVRPRILLPAGAFLQSGRGELLENVIRHEMTHEARKDLLWKWLAVLGTSIHWFNPVFLFFRRELDQSCELACDEQVIRNMNAAQKKKYGETLLELAAGKTEAYAPITTSFCGEKEKLWERLEGILKSTKKSKATLALSCAVILMMSGCGSVLAPDQTILAEVISSMAPEGETEESSIGIDGETKIDSTAELMSMEEAGEESGESEAEKMEESSPMESEEQQNTSQVESESQEETSAEESSEQIQGLLSDVTHEWVPEGTIYHVTDTMEILAAGQSTKLIVHDYGSYIYSEKYQPKDTTEYDVQEFVTLAARALNHLYELSGFRAECWYVDWSSDFHDIGFSLTEDTNHDSFYSVCFASGYLKGVSTRYISSMGISFTENKDSSGISWEDMKKPQNLESMSLEEAALWYYENYLMIDGGAVKTTSIVDAKIGDDSGQWKEVEIYTEDGNAYYVTLKVEGNIFCDIYGPYVDHSDNHWVNPPED